MIAVTSLAPGHKNKDNQKKAIDSWKAAGFTVYSINSTEEIDKLKEYDIEFVMTTRTGENEYGKPYVRLDAFRDFIKKHGDALIINSDILITGDIKSAIEKTKEGVLTLQRYDYDQDQKKCTLFRSGYDAFYITKEIANLLPDTKLALGQCHWDYWLPMVLINKSIKLFTSKNIVIMHKKHELQYDFDSWTKTGRIFCKELGLRGNEKYESTRAHMKINAMMNPIW